MKSNFYLTCILLISSKFVFSQSLCEIDTIFRVLHFTKTTGFDHNTRVNSAAMFTSIGNLKGFNVTDTNDASIFNEIDSLLKFSVIIFSNTSGNSLFNATQKANMESYMNQGGSFFGIHAASDTYRTGWPFYNTLVGAIIQSSPNHTSNNYAGIMDHQITHEILDLIPNPWNKNEEYYYWDLNGGMIDTNNISTLLQVRSTGSQTYDRERPITWIKSLPNNGRSFYTALGHANSNYTDSNNDFRKLISNAVCWAAVNKSAINAEQTATKISGGNVFLEDFSTGIILKSPNGTCYQITVKDDGNLNAVNVACPN